ncbi:SAV_2336 N-terminal domain-related protein [Streptomyces sp. NPDC015139]|uniref:SAV_2336 N-terminal domain-related protein n=1 Tax=Streptomyces sp. NPDC015139 TaxID=3364942 RepID=UPI0036FAE862
MADEGSRKSTGTRAGRTERRGRPEPSGTGAAEGRLATLIAALRAQDGDVRAEDVADALWLARVVPTLPEVGVAQPPAGPAASPEPAAADRADETPPRATGRPAGSPSAAHLGTGRASLAMPGEHRAADPSDHAADDRTAIRVPAAGTLPDAQSLIRALGPLRRGHLPDTSAVRVLDESATVDRTAESRLLLPVLRPARRHMYRMVLLMDVSSSNAVWQNTFEDLRQISQRAGAFSDVAYHYVHEDHHGRPALTHAFESGAGSGRVVPPTRLMDAGRRCLVLVLSDCVGPLWRSGQMHRLVHLLASGGPVAVMQPLPQRMWTRTHLPAEPGLLTRLPGPVGRIGFRPFTVPHHDRQPPAGPLPVPVLPPHAEPLEVWARLVADTAGFSAPGAAALVRADHPAVAAPPASESPLAAVERLRRFRNSASPSAQRLTAFLSAAPLVLPVMQLVQRAMLPFTGPEAMAEVLLSGLLRRVDEPLSPGGLRFDYHSGVREELLRMLDRDVAALVLKHVSHYVERHYGRGARNFPALASAALADSIAPEHVYALGTRGVTTADGDDRTVAGLEDFAHVSAQVVRHYTGVSVPAMASTAREVRIPASVLADRARDHLDDFRRLGAMRHLDAALRELRDAVRAEPEPTTRAGYHAELAEILLTRWSIQPIAEHLREALYAAQEAVPLVPSAYQALARVLELMADEAVAGRLSRELLPPWVLALLEAQRAGTSEPSDEGSRIAAALLAAAVGHLPGPGPGAGADDESPRRYALTCIRLLRRLAVAGAPYARERPAVWCTMQLGKALRTADLLVQAGGQDGGRLARGLVLFDLARHHGPSGLLAAGPDKDTRPDLDASRAYAARAVEDLDAAAREPSWQSLAVEDRCRALLNHAQAVLLARPGRDDEALTETLGLLEQACLLAEGPSGTLLPARARLIVESRLLRARILTDWCEGSEEGRGDREDEAIEAWTAVLPLLAGNDARLSSSWFVLGRLLSVRGIRRGTVGDCTAAVHLLRRAVEACPHDDAEATRRRLQLARSVLACADQPDPGTLSEADAVVRSAPTGTLPPSLAAEAWMLRGDIAALASRHGDAAHCYGIAAEQAWLAEPSRQWFNAALAKAAALDTDGDTSLALPAYEGLETTLKEAPAGICLPHEADRIARAVARLRAAGAAGAAGGDHDA